MRSSAQQIHLQMHIDLVMHGTEHNSNPMSAVK